MNPETMIPCATCAYIERVVTSDFVCSQVGPNFDRTCDDWAPKECLVVRDEKLEKLSSKSKSP